MQMQGLLFKNYGDFQDSHSRAVNTRKRADCTGHTPMQQLVLRSLRWEKQELGSDCLTLRPSHQESFWQILAP